jgi:hypothetical protein
VLAINVAKFAESISERTSPRISSAPTVDFPLNWLPGGTAGSSRQKEFMNLSSGIQV